jgi:hypothetical protein
MSTAQDVYTSTVLPLPASEQLRLAALILGGLSETAAGALDFSDAWTAEDLQDLTAFSLQQAANQSEDT